MKRFSSRKVAAQIQRNVADWDAGRISFAEFGERQRAAWDSVYRGQPPVIGSASSRRSERVMRRLGIVA